MESTNDLVTRRLPRPGRLIRAGRTGRFAALGAPLAAAVIGRLAQFAVLASITRLFSGHDFHALVLAFGLFSAFGILADSGAGNYLLAQPRGSLTRRRYELALRLQALLTVIGCSLAAGITIVVAHEFTTMTATAVLLALAASQIADGMSRAVRSPLLSTSRDLAYAVPDVVQAAIKIVIALICVVAKQPLMLLVVPVTNATVIALAWRWVRNRLPRGETLSRITYLRIAEVGLSGAASALYSQAPLFIGSLLLPLASSSQIALVLRFTQPLEIVPSTLAQQAIPRLVVRPQLLTRFYFAFLGCALILAPLLLAAGPALETIFSVEFDPTIILLVAACTLIPKFGNYALVADLLAGGRSRLRLVVATSIGVFACALAAALSVLAGAPGPIFGALGTELLLAMVLWTLLIRHRREAVT